MTPKDSAWIYTFWNVNIAQLLGKNDLSIFQRSFLQKHSPEANPVVVSGCSEVVVS